MKGYRTLVLNLAAALVGVGLSFDWLGAGMPSQSAGMVMTGLGIANTVLRFFTSTPVGQSS